MRKLICLFGKLCFKFVKKQVTGEIKNIAIIKSGAIGDILMTTPLVRALRKAYPDAKITYIVGEKFVGILKGNKSIDEIIPFDTKKLFDSGFFEKISHFRQFARLLRGRFDTCFVLDKSYLAGLFAYWCKIPRRIGFDRSGEGFANTDNIKYRDVKHEIEYYLDLLKPIDTEQDGVKMELAINKNNIKFADSFFEENNIRRGAIIGIAPAVTKDPGKMKSPRAWPVRNYIELVQRLIEIYKTKIIFFGSKDDAETIDTIQSKITKNAYNSAGLTTVKQAAALIKKCDIFVTHDCGLMHVAAAMGVPVISIFGPTDPRRKAPINKGSAYLWKDSKKCEKCEIYGKFPYCNKHVGTDLIDVRDVLEQVDNIING